MSNRSLHRPPRQSHAGPAYRRRPALLSTRSLRLESLERRELLSATSLLPRVPLSAAAPTVTVAATTTTLTPLVIKAAAPVDANFHVLAQAQPNEWYMGLGVAYTPYVPGAAVPSSTATPLVEQDYVGLEPGRTPRATRSSGTARGDNKPWRRTPAAAG